MIEELFHRRACDLLFTPMNPVVAGLFERPTLDILSDHLTGSESATLTDALDFDVRNVLRYQF